MNHREPVSTIMSRQVVYAEAGQRPSSVRRLLAEHGIQHLPVLRGGALVGLVSSADMNKLSMASYGADERAVDAFLDHQFKLEDIMQTRLVTIEEGDTIRHAAEVLAEGRFHSLPVVDAAGFLVGILTSTDLIRYLLQQLPAD